MEFSYSMYRLVRQRSLPSTSAISRRKLNNAFLLDVNVLLALMWPAHESHMAVHTWFGRKPKRNWATCPLTQAGFVRISSNPAFSPHAVLPQQAVDLLNTNLRH